MLSKTSIPSSHKCRIREYQKTMRRYLVTTRFNNNTWQENVQYRLRYTKIGCIYPTPEPTGQQIPQDHIMFVLEMNNDTNQIMGLGMIRNRIQGQQHSVYSTQNYNRYAYLGKHRIDRKDMTEEEECIMKVFDILCFKGSRHMKRLQGLKVFPIDMLYRCKPILDLVEFISQMFEQRMNKQSK